MDFAAISKALGLPYLHEIAPGVWEVPSRTRAGIAYTADIGAWTCGCEHFARHQTCYHLAVALVKAGGRVVHRDAA